MLLLSSGLNNCCWSFVLRVDTLSIVFVTSVIFACFKLLFCHDSVENVASIDAFHLPVAVQRIFNYNIHILSRFCYRLISEHFAVNRVTLLPTIATLWCTKLCAICFPGHSVHVGGMQGSLQVVTV